MSVSNIGGIVNIIQGAVGLNAAAGGGFASALGRQNQGVAMFPDAVREVLARTDLASSLAAKVALPLANGAAVNSVTTAATAQLVGVVVDNNDSADAIVQIFNTASGGVTLGTTNEKYDLLVPQATMAAFIFYSTPAFATSISWDSTTLPHGSVRSTSGKVTVFIVYVA